MFFSTAFAFIWHRLSEQPESQQQTVASEQRAGMDLVRHWQRGESCKLTPYCVANSASCCAKKRSPTPPRTLKPAWRSCCEIREPVCPVAPATKTVLGSWRRPLPKDKTSTAVVSFRGTNAPPRLAVPFCDSPRFRPKFENNCVPNKEGSSLALSSSSRCFFFFLPRILCVPFLPRIASPASSSSSSCFRPPSFKNRVPFFRNESLLLSSAAARTATGRPKKSSNFTLQAPERRDEDPKLLQEDK